MIGMSLLLSALMAGSPAASAPLPRQQGLPGGDVSALVAVTEEQAQAVERGLEWLAKNQEPNGAWVSRIGYKLNEGFNITEDGKSHLGVTALAGMAFLAGGHLPGRGRYGENVNRALDFVLTCQSEDGFLFHAGSRMYDHAFATLFLAEIVGMTHRKDVQKVLQKAVDFIVRSQNKDGGWRYEPYQRESDMSIVVCQVIALRAARNIGIKVPKSTIDLAARYVVDSAVTAEYNAQQGMWGGNPLGTFRYQRDQYSRTSFPLTAAGVTALHGLGIYSDDLIQKGLEYLASETARFNGKPDNRRGHYFFWYGHYYAVQAMYTAGAPYWEPYFESLRNTLITMQQPDGSWRNDVGPGPALGTAMAVLILEIPYRLLPIFQR
jgi:squalene cyclase